MPGGSVSFYEFADFSFFGANAGALSSTANGPLSVPANASISFTFSATATPPQTITITDNDDLFEDDFQEGAGFDQQVTGPVFLENGTQIGFPGDFVEVEFTVTFQDSQGNQVSLLFGAFAPDGSGTDAGNLTMVFATAPLVPGETYTFVSTQDGGGIPYANLICFVRGTRIAVPGGTRPVEQLRPGDPVRLADGRDVALRWIGRRRLDAIDLMLAPALRPVRIRADAFGPGRPAADLLVSPQHRIVIEHWRAELMFGAAAVLVPAKALVDGQRITVEPPRPVEYFHLMFDDHEIVLSEGIATESLHAGPGALAALDRAAREELLALFPELAAGAASAMALPALRVAEGRTLAATLA